MIFVFHTTYTIFFFILYDHTMVGMVSICHGDGQAQFRDQMVIIPSEKVNRTVIRVAWADEALRTEQFLGV